MSKNSKPKRKPKFEVPCLSHLWWGISIGGRHYNGHITHNYNRYEMERYLSVREAKQYAKEAGASDWGMKYLTRVTEKYETLEDLEADALKWCEKYLGANWLLFDDNYYNPERIIGGKGWAVDELMAPANELAAVWRKVNNTQRMDKNIWNPVYKVWNDCIVKHAKLPVKTDPLPVEKLKETWQK